jgi:polysaccharide pyruvyl transferase WcaK-like protein
MKVLCIGFYGHGNAGDEAIARCLDRYLRQPFKNVDLHFSTEMSSPEAMAVNKSNPFYTERNLISVYDLETIQTPDIVIVGGGDLSALYGLQQVAMAKESSRASMVARIGTSAKDDFLKGGEKSVALTKAALESFDHISVRDRASHDVLGAMGIQAHTGADLAIDMLADQEIELPKKPYGVLVVREVRKDDAQRQLDIAKSVYAAMSRELQTVVIVPFCEADERFAAHVSKVCHDQPPVSGMWRFPGRLQWLIQNSEYLVSVGRLHPVVFAIGARRPCYAVTYPWLTGYDKINGTMHHAGLGHRVADWGIPPAEIGAKVHDAIRTRHTDQETLNIYSGYLKGLMLESLCPVLGAMGAQHGLGIERGMRAGEFKVDDYDESYYFGSRVFRQPHGEFMVYHPSRGDWEGWLVVRDLIIEKMKPNTLLDVGCARGWFLMRMIEAGVKAQGIDMSTAAWSNAVPGMQQYMKVGTTKDLSHRRFDVLTVFDVMEHIFEEDLPEAIESLKQAAGRYIVFNICAAPDDEDSHTIRKGKPVPNEMEWLAVSGHVTIRYRSWWKAKLEDEDWESDEEMTDAWFSHPRFSFPSWQRHNMIILKRRKAS